MIALPSGLQTFANWISIASAISGSSNSTYKMGLDLDILVERIEMSCLMLSSLRINSLEGIRVTIVFLWGQGTTFHHIRVGYTHFIVLRIIIRYVPGDSLTSFLS